MKSLHKVIDILEVFISSGSSEMRLSDIASSAGLDKATVSRMLSVLVDRGYVTQKTARGKYALGSKFLSFSAFIKKKQTLSAIAKPHLLNLNTEIKESVVLFSLDGDKPVFLEEIHSKYPLRFSMDPDGTAEPMPPHCTSVGKILLAEKTDREIDEYIKKTDFKAYTDHSIINPEMMKKHLLSVHSDGAAFDFEEFLPGVASVAAGIRNEEEQLIGCVSVLGPTIRLTKEWLQEMTPRIKQCAMKISFDFGYRKE
jgi:DNA-binding IclR family transcriptional regulator